MYQIAPGTGCRNDSRPAEIEACSWENLLQPELRIDTEETRYQMVQVSAVAYLGCLVTALLLLPNLAHEGAVFPPSSVAVLIVAILTVAALWLFHWHVPVWFLVVQAPYAALLLGLALLTSAPGAEPLYLLFYLLVVLYGTFFFRPDAAAGLIVFCSLSFAAAVFARGEPGWLPQLLFMAGASVTIGLFTGLVVKQFHERAVKDGLTGLINRRMWESLLRQELNKAERSKQPFSILIVDLDRFKSINDEFGHLHGDRTLKRVADTLRLVLREADAPCRWGGDEFTVLLADCGEDEVSIVADRIRHELRDELAISIGTATWSEGISLPGLFHQADTSLYAAKANASAA